MASITSQIKNFVLSHQSGKPISSVSLLKFGRRNTIDKITSVLTKEGFLKRITRGMFVRGDSDTIPGDEEIARTKARIFYKQVERSSPKSQNFFTTGCRSSYQTVHGRHVMKTMSSKRLLKLQLQNKLDEENQHAKAQSNNSNRKSVSKANVQQALMKLIGSNQAIEQPRNKGNKQKQKHEAQKPIRALSQKQQTALKKLFRKTNKILTEIDCRLAILDNSTNTRKLQI